MAVPSIPQRFETMTDNEEICPTCGHLLPTFGCKNVESVGAFCRAPPQKPPCRSCGGDGLSRSTPHECKHCHGTGKQS